MLTDPAFAPWRAEALRRGYASSLAIPLISQDRTLGAITIYSKETDSFTADEIKLLTELANDVAYGLTVLRLRAARERAEKALQAERDFVSAILDTAGALVVVCDQEGRITRFNRACEKITGYTAAEVLGQNVLDFLIPPEELTGARQAWAALATGSRQSTHENHWLARDGTRRLIAWSNTALVGEGGETEHFIATGIDIAERQRAEEQIRQRVAELRKSNAELDRFNRVAVGREERMIELKKEINELCRQAGQPRRYPLDFDPEPA